MAVVEAKKTIHRRAPGREPIRALCHRNRKTPIFPAVWFLANGYDIYFVEGGHFCKTAGERLLYAAKTWKTCCSSARTRNRWATSHQQHHRPGLPARSHPPGERSLRKGQAQSADRDGHRHRQDAHHHGADRRVHARQPGAADPVRGRPGCAGGAGQVGWLREIPAERTLHAPVQLGRSDTSNRLYAVTLQTLSNYLRAVLAGLLRPDRFR